MARRRRTALGAAALADLARSGLTEEDAALMMLEPGDRAELEALGLPALDSYVIPYLDLGGRPTGFRRWRYLEDSRRGLEKATDKRPVRYVQEAGSLPGVYLPPQCDWGSVARDASATLVITEGEKKAAAACRAGFPCIGLGGVSSFKSKRRGLPLLPEFSLFEWRDRDVVVAYDSDAATNPSVVAARAALCRELVRLGAVPRIAAVPGAPDGEKRGLDDLLVELGPDALAGVLERAEGFAAASALHELNSEVAYVRDPGLVAVLADGRVMGAGDFVSHAYSNRHYWEEVASKTGTRMVRTGAARAWLDWEHRLELSRMTYAPGRPRITEDAELNTWPGWGCEPRKGSVAPWRRLLDALFRGHPREREWFERWCALPLQRPGAKMFSCAVLWGVETGTGKSLVGKTLGRIYGRNYTLIDDRALNDARNEWARNKQFAMGDDVTGHDQRRHADRLKAMITQEMMRIDVKYVPSYTVPDVINYLFTSNHPDAFFLEDRDRRDFVHEVTCERMGKEAVDEYFAWLDGNGGQGAQALFHHLLRLDCGDQRPEDPAMETAARALMIDLGQSRLGRWVRDLRESPDAVLRVGDAALQGDLWSAQDLLRVFDPDERTGTTASAVGKEMRRAGFRAVYNEMQVATALGPRRLFAVRDAARWAEARGPSLTEHYNATRVSAKHRKHQP